jgi:DNA anti-recombination protein RmuC
MSTIQTSNAGLPVSHGSQNLADILERVLDKGIVVAGDIAINLLDIELLTIKLRLLIASVDKAQEIGIDWWTADPFLSQEARSLEDENKSLRERLERLEDRLRELGEGSREEALSGTAEQDQRVEH